jgi:hypothetical protein
MPTTSNFGWTTPADTDLVKDGAAAIRTLGNGIDTSMAELKGGTTGQILSKTSNTDMDFTWVSPNPGDITEVTVSSPITGGGTSGSVNIAIQDGTTAQKGAVQLTNSTSSTSTTTAATPNSVKTAYDLADAAIPKSLVDAKADLITATANDTPARLAVGSNGEALVADSAATTGLRWSGGTTIGNPVINGGFDIWARGTSGFVPANNSTTFAADRWNIQRGVTGSTVSRQTTSDSTNLPFIQYAMRIARDSGNTSTEAIRIGNSFESSTSIPYAGKTVTLSFYARAGANYSATSSLLNAELRTGTGTDQNTFGTYTGSATPISSDVTLTTTWQRFSLTGTVASTATEMALKFVFTPVGTAGANDWYEITGVQLDIGSVALPFRRAGGTIQGELAACQRYYQRVDSANASDTRMNTANMVANSTTVAYGNFAFPVRMRTSPTFGSSTATGWSLGRIAAALTALSQERASQYSSMVKATVASGLTAGNGDWLEAGNNNTAYIEFSAEL